MNTKINSKKHNKKFLKITNSGTENCEKRNNGPYYKSKLELKSNSSESLPVNCKFICDFTRLKLTKLKLEFH